MCLSLPVAQTPSVAGEKQQAEESWLPAPAAFSCLLAQEAQRTGAVPSFLACFSPLQKLPFFLPDPRAVGRLCTEVASPPPNLSGGKHFGIRILAAGGRRELWHSGFCAPICCIFGSSPVEPLRAT